MEIVNFTPLMSLVGGILIGLGAVLLMLFNGKIAGISGISKGIISTNCPSPQERNWRIFFVLGLVLGGGIMIMLLPEMTAKAFKIEPLQVILAGLLVGYGTSMGNGCTSGHGVCGLGRKSTRSLASVVTIENVVNSSPVVLSFHIL